MKTTRFERARLLGARALQIASGAPSLVHGDGSGWGDAPQVAVWEWEASALPLSVRRAT